MIVVFLSKMVLIQTFVVLVVLIFFIFVAARWPPAARGAFCQAPLWLPAGWLDAGWEGSIYGALSPAATRQWPLQPCNSSCHAAAADTAATAAANAATTATASTAAVLLATSTDMRDATALAADNRSGRVHNPARSPAVRVMRLRVGGTNVGLPATAVGIPKLWFSAHRTVSCRGGSGTIVAGGSRCRVAV